MKNPNTLRKAALVVALAAITATAWAASETLAPGDPAQARPVWTDLEGSEATPAEPLATQESLAPNESLVRPDDAVLDATPPAIPQAAPVAAVPAPAVERTAAQAPITIEEKRLTLDERIQADVMDRIAEVQNVSGKIGVETHEAMVTLTGYTSTAGQAYRVGRVARGIVGVKGVDNQIRPRIGGSV